MIDRQVARCLTLIAGNGGVLIFVFQFLYNFDRDVPVPFTLVYVVILVSALGLVAAFLALWLEPERILERALEALAGSIFLSVLLGWMALSSGVVRL